MKKLLCLFLLVIMSASLLLTSCAGFEKLPDDKSDKDEKDDDTDEKDNGKDDNDDFEDSADAPKSTVEAVYAQAVDLGYQGSLDDFLAIVSGEDGKSAYEIAVEYGYKGTEKEWADAMLGRYTVTFDLGYDGKTFTLTSENYKVAEPENPVREGYEFMCWVYIGDAGPDSYGDMIAWLFPAFAVTEDMTLVAIWESLDDDNIGDDNTGDDNTGDDNIGDDNTGDDNTDDDNTDDDKPGSTVPGKYGDWTQTDIKIKLTNNSNSSELTSGCQRYYAGADTASFTELDTAIRSRNILAQKAANVRLTYTWIMDSESGKGWGGNIQDMVKDTKTGSTDGPDIYCNFAYDMTCAALRGCFSNLLSEDYDKGNWFRFIQDDYDTTVDAGDYFDSEAGEGYFYQYMESLSLTPDTTLYCLASNYTIDVIRSMTVIPVNVELMNSITIRDSAAGDRTGDGLHDIEDFYELVWENGWDYSALARYSNAIYQAGPGTNPMTDISDNRVGFVLGRGSGLHAASMLYSSSVSILNQKADGSFEYPATNADLNNFAIALKDLFVNNGSAGVCVVTRNDVIAIEPGAKTELDGISIRFAKNNVLFGGIVCVGSLEYEVYQKMNKTGDGFGIVPVPLYRSNAEYGDEYKTHVHNLARIMAISSVTTKFSQCSAYLDYQSRMSADVVEKYYTEKFTNSVGGGTAGEQNPEMLTYIRNHVNDCFDKTYEDAIANYMGETDRNAFGTRWHGMILANEYKMNSFSHIYSSVLDQKHRYIEEVYNAWLDIEKAYDGTTDDVMTYDEYMAADFDDEVVIEAYVQATQEWWGGKINVYLQERDGAYFVYELACSEADAQKLTKGTKIKVKGYKAEWCGEVEICDATFEFVEGANKQIFFATDVTDLLGTKELINHQNKFVLFTDMTVKAIEYKLGEPGDDIYLTLTKNGADYSFGVERYLTAPDTDVYKTVCELKAGDVIDVEGFLYWYEGVYPHITSVTKK